MYRDKFGRNRFTLSERYNYYKDMYETGVVIDRNGEKQTLSRISRHNAGNKACVLLNKINKRSRQHYIDNKYIDKKSSRKNTNNRKKY